MPEEGNEESIKEPVKTPEECPEEANQVEGNAYDTEKGLYDP
jgi:hypothetical protein